MKRISLIFLISFNAHAFLGAGTSAGALFDLVTTTASQLNELEKIVTSTEIYTKQMNEYNQLVRDEYFRAQRVLFLTEQLKRKKQVANLATLNRALRELKFNMRSLEHVIKEYEIIQAEDIQTQKQVEVEKSLNDIKSEMAKNQVEQSINSGTQSRSNQLTAQNTALIHETQVGMHNTQLGILKNSATANRLEAERSQRHRFRDYTLRRSYKLTEEDE